MTTVIPRLPATKQRSEVSVKILKDPVHRLKSRRIHHPAPPPQALPNYPHHPITPTVVVILGDTRNSVQRLRSAFREAASSCVGGMKRSCFDYMAKPEVTHYGDPHESAPGAAVISPADVATTAATSIAGWPEPSRRAASRSGHAPGADATTCASGAGHLGGHQRSSLADIPPQSEPGTGNLRCAM